MIRIQHHPSDLAPKAATGGEGPPPEAEADVGRLVPALARRPVASGRSLGPSLVSLDGNDRHPRRGPYRGLENLWRLLTIGYGMARKETNDTAAFLGCGRGRPGDPRRRSGRGGLRPDGERGGLGGLDGLRRDDGAFRLIQGGPIYVAQHGGRDAQLAGARGRGGEPVRRGGGRRPLLRHRRPERSDLGDPHLVRAPGVFRVLVVGRRSLEPDRIPLERALRVVASFWILESAAWAARPGLLREP